MFQAPGEKKLLIRNSLTFPPCLPAFVFLFTVYSQSSSPITEKSGQGCSFSGLSLSALGEEGIQKNKNIQTPYSSVLCENLYLLELDLSMIDSNVRHTHLDLTIIINYRHVLISKSSPWALMKGWTSKIPSLLERKHCFWVDWGLQCSIAYDFHSPAALWSEFTNLEHYISRWMCWYQCFLSCASHPTCVFPMFKSQIQTPEMGFCSCAEKKVCLKFISLPKQKEWKLEAWDAGWKS